MRRPLEDMRDHCHFRKYSAWTSFQLKGVKNPATDQKPFDPEPKARRTPYQRRKMPGEPIAAIFEIEFEPFGRKYHGAAARPALLARERQRGVLAQKEAANP